MRDDEHGIELTTIHRAKGRQWPRVELFACEEGQLPHRRALDVTPEQRAAGEGAEAERRLAYVAFTRAQERLSITATVTAPSRFLTEAGLTPQRPYEPPPPKAKPQPAPRMEKVQAAPPNRAPGTSSPRSGTRRTVRPRWTSPRPASKPSSSVTGSPSRNSWTRSRA